MPVFAQLHRLLLKLFTLFGIVFTPCLLINSSLSADPIQVFRFPDFTDTTAISYLPRSIQPVNKQEHLFFHVFSRKMLFSTEDGVTCAIFTEKPIVFCVGHWPPYVPRDFPEPHPFQCLVYQLSNVAPIQSGPLPMGSGFSTTRDDQGGIASVSCDPSSFAPTVLFVSQKIIYNNVTCGLTSEHIFACSNNVHGFVLMPGGTNWFF